MINIVYEDSQILVVDKPTKLVVDKSESQKENTLEDWLQQRHPRPDRGSINNDRLNRQGIVHRIDKDTSGLLLVAKTQSVLENLQAQFKERIVKKEYLALVHGLVEGGGIVEGGIGRNPGNREKFTVMEDGKEATTEYKPEGNFKFSIINFKSIFEEFNKIQMRKLERMDYNQFTMLRLFPHTGRTHQIRVHLKYIGSPIVSDEKYVGRKMYRLDRRWCPRQFLHAAKIGFKHPGSGQWMEFESELPEDLENTLKKLDVRSEKIDKENG